MRARLTGVAAVAAFAMFAPSAAAQDPIPTPTASPSPSATPAPSATPTPEPTPTPEERERAERERRERNSKSVRRIYRDFERDGRIDDCDHSKKAFKKARRSIADSYKEDYPDFRDALSAAIERHDNGRCEELQPPTDAEPTPAPPPAAGGGSTPAPAPAPAPAPPPVPDSGTLPDFGAGGGDSGGSDGGDPGGVTPLPGEDAIPEGTPPAPAATPAPPPLPPKLVVTRAATDSSLFVPGTVLAIALLGLLFAALSALAAKRTGRLAVVGHAWREAAWRGSGTWKDFTDWLRLGR